MILSSSGEAFAVPVGAIVGQVQVALAIAVGLGRAGAGKRVGRVLVSQIQNRIPLDLGPFAFYGAFDAAFE